MARIKGIIMAILANAEAHKWQIMNGHYMAILMAIISSHKIALIMAIKVANHNGHKWP